MREKDSLATMPFSQKLPVDSFRLEMPCELLNDLLGNLSCKFTVAPETKAPL